MLWRETTLLNILRKLIADKQVLILGFGREGKSTLSRLLQAGAYASLTIADQIHVSPGHPDIHVLSGPSYMDTLNDYDLVFKSPGIVLPEDPSAYDCQITSQMEVFFTAYREQIIGITGTKGKSTVTTLLYHILKENRRDVVLAGNIGIPAFDILEEIGPKTRIICELSCHQLEYIHVSPHVAVLLNIHEEHLDHYGTMKKYIHAKQQIYLHQKPEDLLLCDLNSLPSKNYCQAQIYNLLNALEAATKSMLPSVLPLSVWKTPKNLCLRCSPGIAAIRSMNVIFLCGTLIIIIMILHTCCRNRFCAFWRMHVMEGNYLVKYTEKTDR